MIRDILLFPIPNISVSEKKELEKQVNSILTLNEEIQSEKIQSKSEQIKQRIEHCEEKIDELIYELYDLEPDEIKIIEEKNS